MKSKNKRELEKHWAEQAKKEAKKAAQKAVQPQRENVNQGRAPAAKEGLESQ
jgi:hypothetical protein